MKAAFIFISLFWVIIISGQSPEIQWQNTIGGSGTDELHALKQTSDGGYILGGYSSSDVSGDKTENSLGGVDYWVIKLDDSGNIQWQNTIGGDDTDYFRCIEQTADNGYIIGGYSYSDVSGDKTENSIGSADFWVIKLDSSGNIQWQNTIGGSNSDSISSLQQTTDGGYILGGTSSSDISGDKTENSQGSTDYWVVKLDDSGNIQWQNTIGGSDFDGISSLKQTTDGGYILGGTSSSNISGDKTENSQGSTDYWVVKLDDSGNIQWQNTIGGNGNDGLNSIQQTIDNGYLLGGSSTSDASGDKTENSLGSNDYWVIKLDSSGNIQWQNTIGGNGTDILTSIHQTIDGNYIIGGFSNSPISGDKTEESQGVDDYWVIKLNSSGTISWQNTIGGSFRDRLNSLQQTTDGGFMLGGYSLSNISGDKTEDSQGGAGDYWVVKLESETLTIETENLNLSKYFPNPVKNQLKIDLKTSYDTIVIMVTDLIGKEIFSKDYHKTNTIDLELQIPSGIYLVNVIADSKKIETLKIVKQ